MIFPYSEKVDNAKLKNAFAKGNKVKTDAAGVLEPLPIQNESKSYTKTEINRMATNDLQKLAKEVGIKEAKDLSGAKLKTMLIEHFNL